MAYSDPIVLPINAVNTSFARLYSPGGSASKFGTADGLLSVEVSHSEVGGRRLRHFIRFNERKFVNNQFTPATNVETTGSVYLVGDFSMTGWTVSMAKINVNALLDFLQTGNNIDKWLAGEA